MEEEATATGLVLGKILPPRLEDAGLEDCALPPDSIKEAFFKAASAVKSRASSLFSAEDEEKEDGECFRDPWPEVPGSDVLIGSEVGVGVGPVDLRVEGDEVGKGEGGKCLGEKGVEEGRDEVVVVGGGVQEGEGVKRKGKREEEEEGGVEGERPTLTEGFVV